MMAMDSIGGDYEQTANEYYDLITHCCWCCSRDFFFLYLHNHKN